MKKTFFNALMLSLSLLALGSSCSDEEDKEVLPVLEVETLTMNFDAKASSQEIQITTNIPDLKVQVQEEARDWCSAVIDGDKLVVSVLNNNNEGIRSTTVIVYRKAKSRKITVSQLGNGLAILVNPKFFKLESGDETEIEFKVTTNVEGLSVTTPNWVEAPITDPNGETRAAAMVDHEYKYTVLGNITTDKRSGIIVVSAVDPELNLNVEIPIEQAGLPKYDPSESGDLAEDIQITPDRGWASSTNGRKIEESFDGNTNGTRWHCGNDQPCPHTIIYYFNNPVALDYIKYYSRQDGNQNGYFGETEIWYSNDPNADEHSQYTHIVDKDFEGEKHVGTRVDFPQTVTAYAIKFIIKTGKGSGGEYEDNLVACEEMEFFQKDTNVFDWRILFTDETCSELKPEALSEEYINANCPFDFYKNLAIHLLKGTYDSEFRVQTYKAYPHPDAQAATNKTNPYSLLDNPTGIAVDDKESIIVFVGDMHGQEISLKIQNLDKETEGKDGFGGDLYPLINGYNKLKISNKGLIYVMYHTKTLEEAETAQPIKIHFASGKVNGYFDSNKHTEDDWYRLTNAAVNKHFDVLGRYAHLTFESQYFKNTTKELIDLYDEIVYEEMKFMGLEKYNRMFRNRMYLNVMYKDYMYATSYHTAYNNTTMGAIASASSLKQNSWGPAHEIGHCNQTRPGLKWLSTTEVTNNICAMHVATLFNEKYDSEIRLRDEVLSGFSNRYEKAMTNTFTTSQALVAESDPFSRLIPFWQLELYINKVLGQEDFYKDLYELVRTEDDIASIGGNQVEFVRRTSQIAQLDLAEFFSKWGFLNPVNVLVEDYAKGQMIITKEDADAVRAKTSVYSKPAHNFEYICEQNVDIYKKDAAIQKGTATRTDNKITMKGWQNVVAYEVYLKDKLVFVSPMQSFTVNKDLAALDETTKVYAIPAKGNSKVEVTF